MADGRREGPGVSIAASPARFTGFPEAALDFYDDLETDNTKTFWAAHRPVYEAAVRAPMEALLTALEPEFGAWKLFRPYRDVRYAKDKTPYKTHQGGFVEHGTSAGWYVQVDARGVMVGVGFYQAPTERLGRFRDAVVAARGAELELQLDSLVGAGWVVEGERLKTAPRGYDAAHPRIALLRHKALYLTKSYGFEPVIHAADLLDVVAADWRAGRPLVDWLADTGVT